MSASYQQQDTRDRPDRAPIQEGMDVVDLEGELVGDVKEVRPGDFLLARPLHRDVYVPLTAVRAVAGLVVTLDIAAKGIGDMDWPQPALFGSFGADASVVDQFDRPPSPDDPAGNPAHTTRPASGSDPAASSPLDTRPGRLPTAGTDDGALPPPADLLDDDLQRRRDLAG